MGSGNEAPEEQRDLLVCRDCRSGVRPGGLKACRALVCKAEEVEADPTSLWVSRWVR